jgi:8-oxo-dGTP diphosphatase
MSNGVWAGTRVFVVDKEKRVLMVKHRYEEQGKIEEFWVIPGGGVEAGEYTADGGIREVKEETGLDIKITRLLWTVEEKSQNKVSHTNYFLGEIIGGDLVLGFDPEFDANNQILKDVRFFTKDELKKTPRVYPEVLRHEFWGIIEEGVYNHQVWRQWNSKGFGIE